MDVALKCRCGALQGVARGLSEGQVRRIVCYCDDCQAYARYLGGADRVLDAHGGTEVTPIAPAKLRFTQGAERLACVRLSPRGMIRWHAACCDTPVANSTPNSRIPFAGVVHTILDFPSGGPTREQALGPVFAGVQGRFAIGQPPAGTAQGVSLRVIATTIRFLATGLVRGHHRPSPFFDAKGEPSRMPYVLTLAERTDATRAP